MSQHLPECPANWGVGEMPDGPCTFCEMLRACEQRVSEETEHAMMEFFYWKPSPPHDKHYFADNICAYCVGRREGLDAAREAVAALPAPYKTRGDFDTYGPYNEGRMDMKDSALAAIDALREKP